MIMNKLTLENKHAIIFHKQNLTVTMTLYKHDVIDTCAFSSQSGCEFFLLLSLCLSVCLSVCLCMCVCMCVCVCVCMCVCVCVCVCMWVCVSRFFGGLISMLMLLRKGCYSRFYFYVFGLMPMTPHA